MHQVDNSMVKETQKILVDEMKDGMDEKLIQLGLEAYSVRKLRNEGKLKGPDFNVITYAQENEMILVTQDGGVIKTCEVNNFPYIPIDEEGILKMVLDKLSKF